MAQGARRPPRHHRQSRQISVQDAARNVTAASKNTKDDEQTEVEKIIITLTNVSPEQLRASREEDKTAKERLRSFLPAITTTVDIDFQLYAFIAIILRLCVQSWYVRITSDRELNASLLHTIVGSIQNLQERLATIDPTVLVLDDIAALLTEHLKVLEFAARPQLKQDSQEHVRKVYHALRPHPALQPAPTSAEDVSLQRQHQAEWSQIMADKVLPLVLPPSDMQNPGLSVIVREIVSEMLLFNGVCEKLCESWFIWESITRALTITTPPSSLAPQTDHQPSKEASEVPGLSFRGALRMLELIWHVVLSAWSILLMTLSANGRRSLLASHQSLNDLLGSVVHDGKNTLNCDPQPAENGCSSRRPLLATRMWSCAAHLTHIDQRMPWLAGGLSLLQWLLLHGPGKVGGEGSTLDRWARNQIDRKLLQPAVLINTLRNVRYSLFPGGTFAPARTQPSSNEIVVIREQCGKAVLKMIPLHVRRIYFATTDEEAMLADVLKKLDLFADPYINKALIISIVELVASQLFPELRAL